MQIENTEIRWGVVQQTLHWAIVLLVVTQLVVGFRFGSMPDGDARRMALLHLHATTGLTIWLVMAFRLYWRRSYPIPRLPDTLTPNQKLLALTTHRTLYLLLLTIPIVGYLLVGAFGVDIPFFGATLPAVTRESELLQYSLSGLHGAGAVLLMAVIALHVTGALRHLWTLRDGLMERMAPFISPSNPDAARIQRGEPSREDEARARGGQAGGGPARTGPEGGPGMSPQPRPQAEAREPGRE